MQQKNHKPRSGRRAATLLLSVLFAASLLKAQERPAPSASAKPEDDDLVLLSPFTVTAESSQDGYLATQVLSATRVRTDLKDVGASIDLMTEQFMNDAGILDVQDALRHVANMSAYDGMPDLGDNLNNRSWYTFPFNSRGFTVGDLGGPMIDFFVFEYVPIDRYNTENLSFLRGPNAILFGIGSPGGAISTSYKRPNIGRNRYEFSHTFDSENTQRFDFDLNYVLLKNKVGLRIAAIDQDRDGFRKPYRNQREAIYGALTVKPFKKTTVTVLGDAGKYNKLWDVNNIIADAYTPWVMAGRPTVNWQTGAGQTGPGKGNFSQAFAGGLGRTATSNNLIYIEGSNLPIMNWINMARGAAWDAYTGVSSFDRSRLNSLSLNETNNTLTTPDGQEWKLDLSANYWGDLNRHDSKYQTSSVFVEQNIMRGLDVELAANEYSMEYQFNAFANATPVLRVDPNELLPDGSPNPYVGMPYLETNRQQVHREKREYSNRRGTLAYEINLEDKKVFRNIGLGRYNLLGLWEKSEKNTWLAVGRLVNTTPLSGYNADITNAQNAVVRRYYLQPGESRFRSFRSGSVEDLDGASLGTGINLATIQAADEPPRRAMKEIESKVGAIQGHLWLAKDNYYRIVGLYGIRRDEVNERAMAFTRPSGRAYPGDWRNFDSAIQSGIWRDPVRYSNDTKSYSFIVRPHRNVSLFYNYSDVFTSGDPSFRDVYGNPTRPTYGDTNDYGVKVSFLDDKFLVNVTRFETVQFDQTFQSQADWVTYPNRIWESIPGHEDTRLVTFRTYSDNTSDGTEVSVAGRLGDWNLRLSGGEVETRISKWADDVQGYVDANRAEWQANSSRPLVNPFNSPVLNTVGQAVDELQRRLDDQRSRIGQKGNNIPRYNASFTASYKFARTDRWWKGLTVGSSVRWAEGVSVGYARLANGQFDRENSYAGADSFNFDVNLSYGRKLFKNRIGWNIYVNIFNVLDENEAKARRKIDVGNATHDAMTVETYLPTPRVIQVRNTFTF